MKIRPSLELLLSNNEIFPLMGEFIDVSNSIPMDFSPSNTDLIEVNLSDTHQFNDYVFGLLEQSGKKYGIGGYFEHRAIYSRSAVFATELQDFRNIHMGVDIWAEAGTPVFAPLDGIVHSFKDNAGFGNYGPTIILEHELRGEKLFSLYGHLAVMDLAHIQVGTAISKGEGFCQLGPFPENGDWPPHLHFQLMWDLLGNWGDFPGVCSHREIEKFKNICPDPNLLIGNLPG
ncbi:peptidoglycan DD-metalloendopeptidase family protein [Aquiflexum sp.]|uniref:peptidoglycan DD-metalloendopeptidase family protein n=1 Tax=Aquiflexum sp. TaxID=1872584 RepID=UPI0035943B4E